MPPVPRRHRKPRPVPPPDPTPTPFRDTGEELGFVDTLREHDRWPLKKPVRDEAAPTPTPYLVIPYQPADDGTRPLQNGDGTSFGIHVVDNATDAAIARWSDIVPGGTYRLSVTILNLGAGSSYAGLVDFYVGTGATFKLARVGKAAPPAFSRSGFSVRPTSEVTVESPKQWTPVAPADPVDLVNHVLVQVSDFMVDPLETAFDFDGDRHVALW